MADKTVSEVKLQFQNGDHPKQVDFEDLIDSAVALSNATDDSGKLDPTKVDSNQTGFNNLEEKIDGLDATDDALAQSISDLTSDDIASSLNTSSNVTDEINRVDTRIDDLTATDIPTTRTGQSVEDVITSNENLSSSNETRLDNLALINVQDTRTTGGTLESTIYSIEEDLNTKIGNWDINKIYDISDIIDYNGTLYKSIYDGTGENEGYQPDTESYAWQPLISADVLIFKGTWNPNNNIPDLTGLSATSGDVYVVSSNGSTPTGMITDETDWVAGDWVVFSDETGQTGGEWLKVNNSSSPTDRIMDVPNTTYISVSETADTILGYANSTKVFEMNDSQINIGDSLIASLTIESIQAIIKGNDVTVETSSNANPGDLNLSGGNSNGSNGNGGNINIIGGNENGTGTGGSVYIHSGGISKFGNLMIGSVNMDSSSIFEIESGDGSLNINPNGSGLISIGNNTGNTPIELHTGTGEMDINSNSSDSGLIRLGNTTSTNILIDNGSGIIHIGGDNNDIGNILIGNTNTSSLELDANDTYINGINSVNINYQGTSYPVYIGSTNTPNKVKLGYGSDGDDDLAVADVGYVALAKQITTKNSAYTITSTDSIILGDTSGGSFTLTLPTAVGINGKIYIIKKIDAAGTLTVNTTNAGSTGSENIDGLDSQDITTNNAVFRIVSDGSNWRII